MQNSNGIMVKDDEEITKTYEYNIILIKSRYTLAPCGIGPNSIRFWEALGAGSIPVLLSDTLELPENKLWDSAILRIKEEDVDNIDTILREISPEEEHNRRKQCIALYEYYKDNYMNTPEMSGQNSPHFS